MGLDVYVGTLSRYYSGDWETIIQQTSHEQGMEILSVQANESQRTSLKQDEEQNSVFNWRRRLSKDLRNKINIQLDWNESAEAPYFTDKPTWDSYSGLLLWAAYAEHHDLKIPNNLPNDWSTDPAYQASIDESFQCNYNQLLFDTELWLPCDFEFTFPVLDVLGNNITIGSTKTLLAQLNNLNDSTWKADKKTLENWLQVGVERGASLEFHARFAFSILHELTKLSVINRLPMKLDY